MAQDDVAARLLFFSQFLREGRRVASVAPSSATLTRAACSRVDRARPQTIVELGAGTGAVTEQILTRRHPDSRVLALELDADFAAVLRRRCPEARVVHGDACELPRHLRKHGIEQVDLVISGLALPSFAPASRGRLLAAFAAAARPGAWFSQITILPLVYLGLYRRLFHDVRFEWAPWNAPPGGVYPCRRVRAARAKDTPSRAHHLAADCS